MAEWENTVHDAAQRAEREVLRLVNYLNDEVVPDVRRHGSAALRVAADRLQELARNLDDASSGADGQSRGGTPRP